MKLLGVTLSQFGGVEIPNLIMFVMFALEKYDLIVFFVVVM